ncbi:capsular polysaccharide synthesis protein, partial [Lachnospiraceae bacterium OttesenSCG-928-D06]|nr:capsular polysaccharide synthesis protein [Lachnospiraceae bacterium OttesenSCG-928-D06]
VAALEEIDEIIESTYKVFINDRIFITNKYFISDVIDFFNVQDTLDIVYMTNQNHESVEAGLESSIIITSKKRDWRKYRLTDKGFYDLDLSSILSDSQSYTWINPINADYFFNDFTPYVEDEIFIKLLLLRLENQLSVELYSELYKAVYEHQISIKDVIIGIEKYCIKKDFVKQKILNYFYRNDIIQIADKNRYDKMLWLEKRFSNCIVEKEAVISRSTEYIWWCWLQGIESAPIEVKICYESAKKFLSDKTFIIITKETYKDFIKLPDYIEEKYKNGKISNTHFSDLLRLELLLRYGGIWVDSTIYFTGEKDINIFLKQELFLYRYKMGNEPAFRSSNWLIAARPNNRILNAVLNMLYSYWEVYDVLIDYFIFHIFFTISTLKYEDDWNNVLNIDNVLPHFLQYNLPMPFNPEQWSNLKQTTDVHKLTYKLSEETKNSINSFYYMFINGRLK